MRKSLASLLVVAGFASIPAYPQDHLVSTDAASARLAEAAARRDRQIGVLDRALSSSQAASMASTLGTDIGRVRAALPALSDAELQDLSARAAALDTDPVAGLDDDIRTLLIIFLVAAIVILVLQAVD
jgi:hypothetical protein